MRTALTVLLAGLLFTDDVEVARGPYIQNVTTDSAVVCAWLSDDAEIVVKLILDKEEVASKTSKSARRHEVSFTDLKPGTAYQYVVNVDTVSYRASFRTFPDDGSEYRFVAYGDCRSRPKIHAKVCKAIAGEDPLFIVHSGDIVENGRNPELWDEYFELAAPYLEKTVVFPSLGNHERDAPEYFDIFHLPGNERWYSFDVGPVHFIILDSNGRYRKKDEQLEWLKKDLKASKAPYKIAVYHHPAFSSSTSRFRIREQELMYKLWGSIFEEGGLTLAVQGHNHNYQRAAKNGIYYITSGGGGAPLYPLGEALPESQVRRSVNHYVRFTVTKEAVKGEAVDLDGKVFDAFTVKKPEK